MPTGDPIVPLGIIAVFFAAVLAILYLTNRRSTTFTDYAVGGRSFGGFYIAMSYTNSWWPGSTYTAFFALSYGFGVYALYGLSYSLLGVTAMYLMAERSWLWGRRFNLRTQPDMMGMRFDSRAVKIIASAIGIISLFPWIVLAMQAMGTVFEYASFGTWSTTTCLTVGLLLIVVRQYWTVRMGMRGLVYTDMFQGVIAYLGAAVLCVVLLAFSGHGWGQLATVPDALLKVPGDGDSHGPWFLFSIILTGIVGSLCWPTSYQRIYTAAGVRSVKQGTLLTMLVSGGFYALLILAGIAAWGIAEVRASPSDGWFVLLYHDGGQWLLGVAVVIVLAATMGWTDGAVQVCGAQFANDIVAAVKPRTDRQLTVIAKSGMTVYMLLAAIVAYLTFDYANLIQFAQVSYQGIVQLSVPMFLGIFWKGGNRRGAAASMVVGFVCAAVLTVVFPTEIPTLGGLTSGVVALVPNLGTYLLCHVLFPADATERARVADVFRRGSLRPAARASVGAAETA